MKPKPEEKQWLQEYLHQVMTYRETYAEIYDHILQALENKPEQKFFASTVNNVISDDFGDYDTLHSMEENCRDLIVIKVKKQYWFNLRQWVKFPGIIYTTIVFICFNYIFIHSILMAVVLFLFVFFAPVILIMIIGLKPGYIFERKKESIKTPAFRKVVYQIIRLYFFCTVIFFPILASIRKIIFHPALNFGVPIPRSCLFSIVGTFFVVHALSLIKTYKFNFNTSIIDNNTETSQQDKAIS
jgi:hypothetical protein